MAKITVVLNVPDDRLFRPEQYEHLRRKVEAEKAGRASGVFRVFTHGAVEERYGIGTIVRAIARLKDGLPSIEFRFMGKGECVDAVLALARELGVADQCRYLGFVPFEQMIEEILAADVCVVAMKKNPYSDLVHTNKMFEYISLRRPVVASRLDSTASYFPDDCLVYFDPDNADDLSAKLSWVQAHPDETIQMIDAASERYKAYGWEQERRKYLGVYEDLLGDNLGGSREASDQAFSSKRAQTNGRVEVESTVDGAQTSAIGVLGMSQPITENTARAREINAFAPRLEQGLMRVSVFGLGYVGCVSAACLAESGHQVLGIDVNPDKSRILQSGRSPVIENDLDEIIAKNVANERLHTAASASEAVAETDVSLVCVGTPSSPNSSLNLDYVARVCEEIGLALRNKKDSHVVCIRSTMVPGSTRRVVVPSLERGFGGKLPGRVAVAVNPEFLREGSAVSDFFDPPKTVVGATSDAAAAKIVSLYWKTTARVFVTSIETAEMVKYVDNTFHAVKIAFANEIGTICKADGVDSHEVMNIFIEDRKLNISSAYLRPGFAFGGSCLPKDVRALVHHSQSRDLNLPLVSSLLRSNDMQIQRAADLILAQGKKRLGFLGMSFKAGTDDLRESPLVRLIETCIGKGYDLRVYDRNVSVARLVGANKAYIEEERPHISRLLVPRLEEVVDFAEVLVVGHGSEEFAAAVRNASSDKVIIDLAHVITAPRRDARYIGLNW